MSDFDTLLDLDMSANTSNNQGPADPFDIFAPSGTATTTENGGSASGDLLDFDFGSSVSTHNGTSAKVNFEPSGNPLYDFTNSEDIMASEPSDLLIDVTTDSAKDKSSASFNPLDDFMENDTDHNEDSGVILTNGGSAHVDLLGDPDLLMGGFTVDTNNEVSADSQDEYAEEETTSETEEGSRKGAQTPEIAVSEATDSYNETQEETPKDPSSTQLQESELANKHESESVVQTVVAEQSSEEQTENANGTDIQDEVEPDADPNTAEIRTDNTDINTNEVAEEKVAVETADTQSEHETDQLINGETATDQMEQEPKVVHEPTGDAEADTTDTYIEDKQPETIEEDKQEPSEQHAYIGQKETATLEAEQSNGIKSTIAKEEEQVDEGTDVDKDQIIEPEPVKEPVAVVSQHIDETDQLDGQVVEGTKEEVQEPLETDVDNQETTVENETKVMPEPVEIVQQPIADVDPEPMDVVHEPVEIVQEPVAIQEPEPESVEIVQEPVDIQEPKPAEIVQEPVDIQEPEPELVEIVQEPVDIQEPEPAEIVQVAVDIEEPEPETAEVVQEPVDIQEPEHEAVVQEPRVVKEPEPLAADSREIMTDVDAELEQPAEEPKSLDVGVDQDGSGSSSQAQRQADSKSDHEGAIKVNGTTEVNENGLSDDETVRDPNIFRETRDKEEVHFAELSDVRQRFESSGSNEPEVVRRQISLKDEYDQGGEYESTPVKDPDVAREGDQSIGEELPEVGMARNILSKFQQMEKDSPVPKPSLRFSPPRQNMQVEYESQPAPKLEQYEGKSESGVFESMPTAREDIVRADDQVKEDPLPEKGSAKNLVSRFKEYQEEAAKVQTHEKKELTPDRSGKVEYTSEPRSTVESYEGKTDSGVFENIPQEEEGVVKSSETTAEIMPESGMAKSLLSKFKQFESEVGDKPPPSPSRQREITPDRTGKVEFVSEPRGFLERYEPKEESGIYENEPTNRAEVIKSDEGQEDILPEAGTAKKTMERFKELQKQSSSPVTSQHRQMTPPPEAIHGKTVSGVLESTPAKHAGEVVRSEDIVEEELPEQGMAKNLLNKFKQIQSESYSPTSPTKQQKEFTPPPESGVYESTPKASIVYEERAIESGVLESSPSNRQSDVVRESDYVPAETELPEKGAAKSMVSKFRQLENDSANNSNSSSPKYKEFTPPRDTRGLMSPKSPAGAMGGVQPNDLPGQYQQSTESGIYENEPVSQPDVYREADTDWMDGLPAENTTKSMLNKFKAFQQKAIDDQETPKPISRKDDSPPPCTDTEDKGMQFAVQSEKCDACGKTVYAMEKMELNNHVYHRNCFKCSHCSARLTPNTFSMNEGIIFCMNHFKQLFARKGNYDEGFGRQQYKKRWQEEQAAKNGTTA